MACDSDGIDVEIPELPNCQQTPWLLFLLNKDKAQNGALGRIEAKVDKLMFRLIAGMASLIVLLAGTIVTILTAVR